MNKYIILIVFSLSYVQGFSQNNYRFIDSLLSVLNTENYKTAIIEWEHKQAKSPFDPRRNAVLLNQMKKSNDIERIKALLEELIKIHGLKPEYVSSHSPFNELLETEFKKWFTETYDKYYPEFIVTHADKIETIHELDRIYWKDQYVGSLFMKLNKDRLIEETDLTYLMNTLNTENFWDLVELCQQNKELPNSFDYEFRTSSIINLVLQHNSSCRKDSTQFHSEWNAILPYLKQAWTNGKIDNNFIYFYDYGMKLNFDYQYYGTIEGIKIIDQNGLRERQSNFKIDKLP